MVENMKEENMRFGQFIRTKRLEESHELILKDISSAIDLPLSMLSDIEKGRRKTFDSDKIEAFCEYLNLTPEDKTRMYDIAARDKSETLSKLRRNWI